MAAAPCYNPSSVKLEVKAEREEDDYHYHLSSNDITQQEEEEEEENNDEEENPSETQKPKKRTISGCSSSFRRPPQKPILHTNKRRLSALLHSLARAHRWKEAASVLSVLLSGTPRASDSLAEGRGNFLIAMELHRRFMGDGSYPRWIKEIYEIALSKLSWSRKSSKKKHLIQLELALFYLVQGNIQEAHSYMKFLVQGRDSSNEPSVNLIYGLILYQIWYSSLPEEMQLRGSGLGNHMPFEPCEMEFNDGCEETEMAEISNEHYAVDIEDAEFSAHYASQSSVCIGKVSVDNRSDVLRKKSAGIIPPQGFYMSLSAEADEQEAGSPNWDGRFLNSSIFFAHGLDMSLLPIRLKHLTGDIKQTIYSYRMLVNEHHRDAVKHMRIAFYSKPPVLAALLPLIQLLLLGDQVDEAFKELENCCNNINTALPFRLKGRLLECFCSNKVSLISSCYENALKRDPTCDQSLGRLIKMHKTGNYSTMLLLEVIALYLDAGDGKCIIWGEFASCFLKLLIADVCEFEDRISANIQRGLTHTLSSNKMPKYFTGERVRDTWRVRCRWWATRHFSNSAYLLEKQAGDWKLLSFKAACASHLYSPRFEYVISVLSTLRTEADTDNLSFLRTHMQNSMKLRENLDRES